MSQAAPTQQPQVIRVTRPPAGTTQAVASQPGAQLQLEFPEGQATFARAGNDLAISVEGGGTVTLTNFFVVGEQSLPTMKLADGTEVAAADFLAAQNPNMDLTTAAGPGAGAPASGGEGSYADDAGALLGGVNKLGSQGTVFWDRATEIPELLQADTPAGGSFDFGVITETLGGEPGVIAGVYEDGMPRQNQGIYDQAAGQILIAPSPNPGSSVGDITISGLPGDATLWLGDPNTPGNTPLTPGPGGVYTFAPGDFTGPGVFILPGDNDSDADFPIIASVTFTNGVQTVTVTNVYTVVVDAVADLPAETASDIHVHRQWHTETKYVESVDEDGTRAITTGELKTVAFDVKAFFNDTVDGSERHTIEVRGVPAEWALDTAKGLGANYDYSTEVDADGRLTYIFTIVDNDDVNGFFLDSQVAFKLGDWTESRLADGTAQDNGSANIEIVAAADEINLSGGELNPSNNHAEVTLGRYELSIVEDAPDFKGCGLRILSDESLGVQRGTDEISLLRFATDISLQCLLNDLRDDGIAVPKGLPVSVAREGIAYDLHSDGVNDAGGNAGQAFLGFRGDNGGDSGWKTTAGEGIFLYYTDGGVAVGRVGVWNADAEAWEPAADGRVAFVVAAEDADGRLLNGVNQGSVTFIQYESLEHPKPGDPGWKHNEKMSSPLELTLVLVDDDGDETTLPVSINVRDDGPKLFHDPSKIHVSETDLPAGSDPHHLIDNVPGNLLNETLLKGFIGFSHGADGPAEGGGFAWNLDGLAGYKTYSAAGETVDLAWKLSDDGLTLTGFAAGDAAQKPVLTIEAKLVPGGAAYEVDLDGALYHDKAAGNDKHIDLGVGFTITDGDGDTVSGDLTVSVKDDVPFAGCAALPNFVFEAVLRDVDRHMQAGGELIVDFNADNGLGKDVYWNMEQIEGMLEGVTSRGNQLVVLEHADGASDVVAIGYVDDAGNTVEVIRMQLHGPDASGKYSYEYDQFQAVDHVASGAGDWLKVLPFEYVVKDSDGDTASNTVAIHVVDSLTLPSADAFHLDESNHDRDGDPAKLSGVFVLDNLDYSSPDPLTGVEWNEVWTQKALDKITDDLLGTPLTVKVDVDDPSIMRVYNEAGELAVTLTLSLNADGKYEIAYEQVRGLDHPLGGLFHDDKLALPLVVDSLSADHDRAPNLVMVIVDDDGPRPLIDSNVALLEGVGNKFVVALYEGLAESLDNFKDYMKADGGGDLNPDFWDLDKLVTSLGGDFADALTASLQGTDGATLMDLITLVMGKDYSSLGTTLAQMLAADPLGFGLKLLTDPTGALGDVVDNLPTDAGRTEHAGVIAAGALSPDYGFDGPAEANPVQWDAKGISLLFKLMGVKATGDERGLALDAGASSATTLVFTGDDGQKVLTLSLDNADPLHPSYSIEQHAGLEHSAGPLEQLLTGLVEGSLDGLAGQLNTLLATALQGAGIPAALLENLDTAALLDILGISPEALLRNIGSGNLLTLPLPIVITDHDGDVAPGLISVTIRDSVPDLGTVGGPTVAEADLPNGTDFIPGHTHNVDNRGDGNNTEHEETDSGSFTFKLGYDASGATAVVAGPGGSVDLLNIAAGDSVAGHYGKLTVTSVSGPAADGTYTVNYTYELTDRAQHAADDGANRALAAGEPAEAFRITITDGDGDAKSADLNVTIVDDVPVTHSEWDVTDTGGIIGQGADAHAWWGAEGNILTGAGVTGADGASAVAGDAWGADGPADYIYDNGDLTAGPLRVAGTFVAESGETAVSGKYGTLYIQADGTYRYEADTAKVNAALGEPSVIDGPHLAPSVAITASAGWSHDGIVTGIDFSDLKYVEAVYTIPFIGTKVGYTVAETAQVICRDAAGNVIGTYKVPGDADGNVRWELPDDVDPALVAKVEVTRLAPDVVTVPAGLESTVRSLFVNNGTEYKDFTVAGADTAIVDYPELTDLKEVFDYTLTDRDGDATSAALTINLKGVPPTIGFAGAGDIVYEAHMPGGSLEGDATHGHGYTTELSYTVTLYNGADPVFTIGGKEYAVDADGNLVDLGGNAFSAVGASYGKITGGTFDGAELKLTYELTGNYGHDAQNPQPPVDAQIAEDVAVIKVTVSTGFGLSAEAEGTLSIADDVPAASSDWVGLGDGGVIHGDVIKGTCEQGGVSGVAGTDPGRDSAEDATGADKAGVWRVRLAGGDEDNWVELKTPVDNPDGLKSATVGNLTIYEDGTYTYKPETTTTPVEHPASDVLTHPGSYNKWTVGFYRDNTNYGYEVVTMQNGLPVPIDGDDGLKFDITQGGMGVKGGNSANPPKGAGNDGNAVGFTTGGTREGIRLTPPADTVNHMTITLVGLGDGANEMAMWIAYGLDGTTVIDQGFVPPASPVLDLTTDEYIGNIVFYPGTETTFFRIGGATASSVTTITEMEEATFDYQLRDHDGDVSSIAQLHFHDDNGPQSFHLADAHATTVTGTEHADSLYGWEAGHESQPSDLPLTIEAGDGNDLVHGGDGNDLLHGGKGDDILFGGLGQDTFAWHATDYDGGTDRIMDFSLTEGDKLRFEGLLDSGDNLSHILDHGLKAFVGPDKLTLTFEEAGQTLQNVEVNFSGTVGDYTNFNEFSHAYNHADDAGKQEMLSELLKAISG